MPSTQRTTSMDIKQMKLNSLLEVTQSINSNLPEEALYRIFYFISISTAKFEKFALVVKDLDGWSVKAEHGFKVSADHLKAMLAPNPTFNDVDDVLSVEHKGENLAYLLLSGGEFEGDRNEYTSFLKTLANIIMVAIENKRFARKEIERQAVKKEMEIASKVQNMLFPKQLPNESPIAIDAYYLPHKSVGGDYYDYISVSDTLKYVCIADVSGKGMPAALLMSNFQASLRTMISQTGNMLKIIEELNRQLIKTSEGHYFITFFLAKIDFEKQSMLYVNAGHNPVYLQKENELEKLHVGTTVLGAFDNLPMLDIGETTFEKDSRLFMYTDGITETKNSDDEEWGEERLEPFLQDHPSDNGEELIEKILKEVDDFRGEVNYVDDLTIVVCSLLK